MPRIGAGRSGGGRLFYGWTIAWLAFGIQAVSYGVQFSFGVLIPGMEADTGWSRTGISLAYSLYVLLYSSLSSVSGYLTDRWGPRAVIAAGGVFLGAGYVLTALSRHPWQLYLSLGVLAAIGMSASFVPCNATVVRWFERRRGQALSISTAGSPLGSLVLPPLAGVLAGGWGWRTAYVVMGVGAALWLVAASRFMFRSPEERGLAVDGGMAPPAGATSDEHLPTPARGVTASEAVRTPEFWLIFAIFASTWIAVFFPLVHLAPYAESLGLSRSGASIAVSAIGIGGLVGRLGVGGFSDRLGRHTTLGGVMAIQVVAFGAFAVGSSAATLYPAAVAFGLGYGASTTLFPAVVADHMGRRHAGAIVGLLFAGAGSVAAVGPTAAGYLYDATGSYQIAFVLSGASNLVSMALIARLWALARGGARLRLAVPSRGS